MSGNSSAIISYRLPSLRHTADQPRMLTAFHVGQTHHLGIPITRDDLARYVALSGDTAPLHVDAEFAKAAGFDGVVVHGAYLMALVSRLVGTEFPGPRSVLERAELPFASHATHPVTSRWQRRSGRSARLSRRLYLISRSLTTAGLFWHRARPGIAFWMWGRSMTRPIAIYQ
ncbi:MaoC/PaaZ C-terminal domain-containing protein [Bradyrhizobium liaoningense]|uniref:MaoC/PaaZ C-terminal domain-containing protein n=1 Tax=Bradyrhizobium liaoningense TaxID=43992 RepID=UPI0009DA7F07